MSIRTIIEINHDYLHTLDEKALEELKVRLSSGMRDLPVPQGIRILGQRHHTEKLKLEVTS